MDNLEAKIIAQILIAKAGQAFDIFAFEECEISDDEQKQVLDEIHKICNSTIQRISKKYGIDINSGSTKGIVESVLFE